MTITTHRPLLLLALALVVATAAAAGQARPKPQIGYLYPAGGQRGTVVEILAGGQRIRGAKHVYISGKGVTATVVAHFRPPRNLQTEQRITLIKKLIKAKETRLAELPKHAKGRNLRLPGESSLKWLMRKPKPKDDAKDKKSEQAKAKARARLRNYDPKKLPGHPLLRNIDDLSLRQLYNVADEFFNYTKFRKKQPNAQLAEMVLLKVTIAADAPPGNRELRLGNRYGLTNAMCFQVGTLPEANEQEPNGPKPPVSLPEPPPLDLPVVLNGQILPGDIDRFRFRAQQGQKLVVVTHARHLVPFLADAVPGWFQATVALYNAKGAEMAFADDYRFDPDPVLLYHVPATGVYTLEIRDSIYRGREDFVYRIAVGELPFITQVFPLGAKAGQEVVATIDGWNLPRKRLPLDTQPDGAPIRRTALHEGKSVSNEVTYAVNTLPEATDTEPNNDIDTAQQITLPCIINGRIAESADVDVFQFNAAAGARVVADVQARRLHSPLDSLVRLTDATGHVLKWNDDAVHKEGHLHTDMGLLTHHADSTLIARLPKAGRYYVHLADTQRHGGPAYAYRLRISPPRPEFTLHVSPSSLSLPAGRVAPLTIHALRRDGFQGDINVLLKNPPPGFKLAGGTIPAGRNSVRVTLTVPKKAPPQPIPLSLEGRASVGDTTIRRPAIPSDNVMQAFLYRHLAPSQEFVVTVVKTRWIPQLPALATSGRLRIPAGGTAVVLLKTPQQAARRMSLELVDPPKGVTIQAVKPVAAGLTFEIKVDGKVAKAGLADNLIVQAFTQYEVRAKPAAKSKKAAPAAKQMRRAPLSILPAIPILVVER